ncbi:hypothetical protein MLD38_016937 [Melastoma candidum]|uniref:Uncharacterized protein n=1 Tax=Melastoma candidum TaxID=119954 RepID=A0ACB9QPL2_9MYRT|nr:hypothetical protein MLD38_016937 [Melastoma candidum]
MMSPRIAVLLYLGILSPLFVPASVVTASTIASFLSPILSPIAGDICKEVVCGKGSCRASINSTALYECVCDPGWKQAVSDDAVLRFLPCVIPNCTLDNSCLKAQSPAQDKSANDTNQPFHSPCRWVDCGGGTCNETSPFSYGCICEAGYANLLNVSAFPCFQQCQLGLNCRNLGISVSNASSSPSIANNSDTNQGSLITQGGRTWWPSIIAFSFLALLCL